MIVQDAPHDPLSDVLAMAGLRTAGSVRLTAGGPWALRFQPTTIKFNVVQHGHCWLIGEGRDAVELRPGDCFVVSRRAFVLASDPDVPATDAAAVFAGSPALASYGTGNDVSLLGGSVTLGGPVADQVLDLLPACIIVRAGPGHESPFRWLLQALEQEWRQRLPGGRTACNDLLRLMFIHALRQHIAHADPATLGWLAGLRDPAVASALQAIHAAPDRTWTLAMLCAAAGLSRSALAQRFRQSVGVAPIAYAAQWKMRVAAARLLTTNDSVSRIAASLGFLSDAAFGAAFRRVHGTSPGRYRSASRNVGTEAG